MGIVRIGIAVFALVLSSGISAAESSTPLTQENIQRFLQSMPDVQKLGEKFSDDEKGDPLAAMATRDQMTMQGGAFGMAPPSKEQLERAVAPLTSSLSSMRVHSGYDEMVAAVKRHGFNSVEEWATIGDRSIRAYAALQMETEAPELKAQMAEMKASLEKSGMPAAQQEAMLKMMDSSVEVMQAFADVSDADKKAVEPFAAQFEQLGH